MNKITVGISDLKVAKGDDVLVTYALGSCVGICLWDSITKIGGLSHIMLPDSRLAPGIQNHMKFADTGVVMLVEQMAAAGAQKFRIKAKIAGGAQMFSSLSDSSLSNIGPRNVEAVKAVLQKLHIPILAEDTGKNYGRTVYFCPQDGVMRVTSVNKGEWTW